MIRLVYPTDPNFGDAMSPLIVEKLSGQRVVPSGMWNADMMAVGSVFYRGDYFMADTYHANLLRRAKALAWDFRRLTSRPVVVWGSGFLQYPPFERPHLMRKLKVFALRGLYTRKILEKFGLMFPNEKVAYGDPGLLFSDLFETKSNPKYDIGIIPHKYDVDRGWLAKLNGTFQRVGINVKVINVADDPNMVVSQISECNKIISSSLHGLIVADSIGIPNLHMVISTLGHSQLDYELKFRDYYSVYGEAMPAMVAVEDILDNPIKHIRDIAYHKADGDKVAKVKEDLLKSFPQM